MKDIKEKNKSVKNSAKFLHPKSRKCVALVKQFKKNSKKVKAKQESKFKQTLVAEKLLWFQRNINPDISSYTTELIAVLVEKYIGRNDDELEQIDIKRSIGDKRNQQHAGRKDAILITKERELRDYESCGLEIPNLSNTSQLNMLKNWNGDLNFLPNLKLCLFNKKSLNKQVIRQQNNINKTKLTIIENSDATDESKSLENNQRNDLYKNQEKMCLS